MTEKCRGIEYRYGSPVACSAERGNCLFHDAEGKMFPEDAWGRRLPYDEETKRTIDRQMRRSRGYDGGVEDERAAVVAWLEELSASSMNHDPVEELLYAARSIERGEHRREEER